MYLLTTKVHAEERPLLLCKELQQAKTAKFDFKLSWSDELPIKLYEIEMKEIMN